MVLKCFAGSPTDFVFHVSLLCALEILQLLSPNQKLIITSQYIFSRFDGLACRLDGTMHFSSSGDNTRMVARAKSAHKEEGGGGRDREECSGDNCQESGGEPMRMGKNREK